MDTLKKYQDAVVQFMEDYAADSAGKPVEKQVVADRNRNRFLVVAFGWPDEDELECFTIFHFEIKNGKVWIQQNWTEIPVADELIERGVRREDIVLGFVPDYARADTGFAVA